MKIIKGNLLDLFEQGRFTAIGHGCNCFNTMGSGIARQIKDRYPGAYAADCETDKGSSLKLGGFSEFETEYGKIYNMYTQFDYGTDFRRVEYGAIRMALGLIRINNLYNRNFSLGIPKIGCGLAGGDENILYQIIEVIEGKSGEFVTVVEFDG